MNILNFHEIKLSIERTMCQKCGKYPKITFHSSDKFTITCCHCPQFKERLTKIATDKIKEQATKSIEDAFKKFR